jgi:hypothetical protein
MLARWLNCDWQAHPQTPLLQCPHKAQPRTPTLDIVIVARPGLTAWPAPALCAVPAIARGTSGHELDLKGVPSIVPSMLPRQPALRRVHVTMSFNATGVSMFAQANYNHECMHISSAAHGRVTVNCNIGVRWWLPEVFRCFHTFAGDEPV